MNKKIFFHIDVNSAYLSWESAHRKKEGLETVDLRDIPSAITGDPSRRSGIVLAKSTSAKQFGVKTGEPIQIARRKCPQLYTVAANFDLYIEYSNMLMNLLKEYSPNLYQYSIDEAFLDMTGTTRLYGNPIYCANNIREHVKRELGFTINVGIGNTMATAKMAGEFSKPDKTHTLFEHEIKTKLWNMPIEHLFFVGKKSSKKLRNIGIETIGDLAILDKNLVIKKLKSYGEIIHNHANGLDGYVFLREKTKNKSIGNSTTTGFDICDYDIADAILLSLCETVCARLRKRELKTDVVSIELVDIDFKRYQKQKRLIRKTNNVSDIHQCAYDLLNEIWNMVPLRHMGVSTSNVQKDVENQISFISQTYSKEQKLYCALDEIRDKYGSDSIKRAVFIDSSISHMEGGTSKSKKNGLVYL